jgi:hypothetical protein
VIIDSIVGILTAMLTGVLGLAPTWGTGFGANITAGAGDLGAALAFANAYFPVVTLGACLGVVIGAKFALMGWSLCKFIYAQIPFKAS